MQLEPCTSGKLRQLLCFFVFLSTRLLCTLHPEAASWNLISLFISITKIPFLPSVSEQKLILSGYQSSPDPGSLVLCSYCINRDPTVLKYTHLNCILEHLDIVTSIHTILHISVPWLPNLESFHIPSGLDLEFCTQGFSRVSRHQVHEKQQKNLSEHQHSPVKSP